MRSLLLNIILLLLLGASSARAAETLTFAVGEDHPMTSLITRIMNEAYLRLDIEIEVKELPGSRATRLMKAGLLDGELFMGPRLSETLDVLKVPVPIAYGELVAFSRRGDMHVQGWESLSQYHIGTLMRYEILKDFQQLPRIRYARSAKALIGMLEHKRFELVILPRRLGEEILARMHKHDIQVHEPALSKDALFHYLHKKNAHLLSPLTQILQQMQASGELLENG